MGEREMKLLRALLAAFPLMTVLALTAVLLPVWPAQSAPGYSFTQITDKWSGINGTTREVVWSNLDHYP
jgi:hypothetical protein